MANTILNDPAAGNNAATFAPQARPDKGDVDAWVAAIGGTGVLSGCTVALGGQSAPSDTATASAIGTVTGITVGLLGGATFRAATSNTGTSSAAPSITIPASAAANDVLLLHITVAGSHALSTPTGWTLLESPSGSGGTFANLSYLYARTAQAGDGGTTVTFSTPGGGTATYSAVMLAYSGGTSVDTHTSQAGTTDTTSVVAPGLTVNGPDVVIYFFGSVPDGGAAPTFSGASGTVRQSASVGYSGCQANESTFTNGMTVAVAAGQVIVSNSASAVSGTAITIAAADATNPRVDLIVWDNTSGAHVITGTAANTAVWPTYNPTTQVLLGTVTVPANTTNLTTSNIVDKRVVLKPPYWVRQTSSHTTASLAANAQELSSITLAKSYRLLKVTTNVAARVRLYDRAAKQTADASRTIGTQPSGDHGLDFEFVGTSTLLSLDVSPPVVASSMETTPSTSIPLTVDNLSGSTSTVTVTLTFVAME